MEINLQEDSLEVLTTKNMVSDVLCRWQTDGRRRQMDGHRSKVGDEGGDGVVVLGAAKRPPKLQEIREFEDCVSSSSKRSALDHKLIADRPEGPGNDPNLKPPNVERRQGGVMEFGK